MSIWRRRVSSFSTWPAIFFQACKRVEWVLPPKAEERRMRESLIISLARYMATWRGKATSLVRDALFRSLTRTPNIVATLLRMFSTEIFLWGAYWKSSLKVFSTTLFCDIEAHEAAISAEAIDRSFELADVIEDVLGDEKGDFLGDAESLLFGFMLQDGDAGFQVGNADMCDKAPFHPRDHALGEFELPGGFVACDDDLFALVDQAFKCVAEFFFEIQSALQELDIVDEQDIERAIKSLHPIHRLVAQIVDEVVDEPFCRDAMDAQFFVMLADIVSDRMQQMCFS